MNMIIVTVLALLFPVKLRSPANALNSALSTLSTMLLFQKIPGEPKKNRQAFERLLLFEYTSNRVL